MREADEEIAENGSGTKNTPTRWSGGRDPENASISMLSAGSGWVTNRAAPGIIETMEKEGLIGPSDGIKAREVYVQRR